MRLGAGQVGVAVAKQFQGPYGELWRAMDQKFSTTDILEGAWPCALTGPSPSPRAAASHLRALGGRAKGGFLVSSGEHVNNPL